MTRLRPVMRYHGGKHKLAPWIVSQLPAHRIYVEPYGGAASVLMLKPRSYAEVYNDLDGDVVNVFRVLRNPDQAAELRRLLELTPFSAQRGSVTTRGSALKPHDVQSDEAGFVRHAVVPFGAVLPPRLAGR